ncbi:MAG: MFS transporter [Rhizomicrobium sp.]
MAQAGMNAAKSSEAPRSLLAFSLASFPTGAFVITLAVYLPNYFTSALGLPLATVGAVFAIIRLFDIGVDPLLGIAMDHTRTPIGRYRPWLMAAMPVLLVATAALYLKTTPVSAFYLAVWLIVLYAGYSMMMLSLAAWASVLVVEYHARSRIYGWLYTIGILGSVAVLLLPQVTATLWPTAPVKGVPLMGWFLIVFVPLALGATATFAHEPERPRTAHSERVSIKDYLALFLRPEMRRILFSVLFCVMGPAITAPLYIFFFEQARDYTATQTSWLLMIYLAAGFFGPPLWMRVAHRLGKHPTVIVASVCYALAQTFLLMLPPAHVAEMSVAMFMVGFVASSFVFLLRAMVADVSDDVLLETEKDRTGLLYALETSTEKIGSTVSVGIAYALLPLFGFNAAAGAINTPHAIWGLELCYLGPPSLSVLIGGLAMWGYKLDERRHATIRRELDERRLSETNAQLPTAKLAESPAAGT